jgi:type IV pilus assembly protein PilA
MSSAEGPSRGEALMKNLRTEGRRGFTLVELMIVVAIVGVLAVIALVGYNKYMRSAAAGEARAMLLSIRGAQDSYKTEVLTYKSCGAVSTATDYYPRPLATLDNKKAAWDGWGGAQATCWKELNVRAAGPVRYSFATEAGAPGPINIGAPPSTPSWPFNGAFTSNDPWFVAVAAGNYDGPPDTNYSILYTSSGQSEVTVVDDTQ